MTESLPREGEIQINVDPPIFLDKRAFGEYEEGDVFILVDEHGTTVIDPSKLED